MLLTTWTTNLVFCKFFNSILLPSPLFRLFKLVDCWCFGCLLCVLVVMLEFTYWNFLFEKIKKSNTKFKHFWLTECQINVRLRLRVMCHHQEAEIFSQESGFPTCNNISTINTKTHLILYSMCLFLIMTLPFFINKIYSN